jgi:hypothetical protein
VTGEFGPERELDVFLTRVVGPLAGRHRDDESIRRLDAVEAGEWTRNEDELLRALRKQRVHQTAFDQLERR